MTKAEKDLLTLAVEAIMAKKGQKVVSMDLRGLSPVTDWFVICQGSNLPQIKAICENVDDQLAVKAGANPLHIEGYKEGQGWILMDYGSLLVHIFMPEERLYYNLERLWGDAPQIAY